MVDSPQTLCPRDVEVSLTHPDRGQSGSFPTAAHLHDLPGTAAVLGAVLPPEEWSQAPGLLLPSKDIGSEPACAAHFFHAFRCETAAPFGNSTRAPIASNNASAEPGTQLQVSDDLKADLSDRRHHKLTHQSRSSPNHLVTTRCQDSQPHARWLS